MISIGILGTKIGMTQIFNIKGIAIPTTIIQIGPCTITQVKSVERDGYNAIQLGYYEVHSQYLTKAELGHLGKENIKPLRYLSEYKVSSVKTFHLGDLITAKHFQAGQHINISGKTIGKGFTGYQKRHNFSRGPMTHGSKNHRQPGSIGPGTTPGRVFPGKKMAGRSGNTMITIKNLEIIEVDISNSLIAIRGSVPGANGNLLKITTQ
uniref:Large ribosomal subunit protein uL3c n=1 Tax=Hildenbrandia rubra TaxID=31481 RepID=A0A1C9CGD3_9FLOR|nr:ribosomal protein L3 [Hildenbrandia rubra]AOM67434.1 ribosomal protein L3 [Hildenbrandia rubra]